MYRPTNGSVQAHESCRIVDYAGVGACVAEAALAGEVIDQKRTLILWTIRFLVGLGAIHPARISHVRHIPTKQALQLALEDFVASIQATNSLCWKALVL